MSSIRLLRRNRWHTVFIALVLLFAMATPLFAATFRGADVVTIAADEVIDDDLFIGANIIVVDGVVNGDLVAAGSQIAVNGEVKGSLLFAGQTLLLNGRVDGTVYSGGTALIIGSQAEVGRNLLFGGFSLQSDPGSTIRRDMVVGGYQAILKGEIERDLYASLGALEINGLVQRDVHAVVDQPSSVMMPPMFTGLGGQPMLQRVSPGLRVGPEARIGGTLDYVSPVEQSGAIATAPEGGIAYSAPPETQTPPAPPTPFDTAVAWMIVRVREIASLFVLGLLALWLTPKLYNAMSEGTMEHSLLSGAWGIVVSIVGYAGALLLALFLIAAVVGVASLTFGGLATSLFGLGFGGLIFAFTLFSMAVIYGSKLVVVYPVMQSLFEKWIPSLNRYHWIPLLVGVVTFVLLRSIPWVGLIISLAVTFVGLGSMLLTFRDRFTRSKTTVPSLALTPA